MVTECECLQNLYLDVISQFTCIGCFYPRIYLFTQVWSLLFHHSYWKSAILNFTTTHTKISLQWCRRTGINEINSLKGPLPGPQKKERPWPRDDGIMDGIKMTGIYANCYISEEVLDALEIESEDILICWALTSDGIWQLCIQCDTCESWLRYPWVEHPCEAIETLPLVGCIEEAEVQMVVETSMDELSVQLF